MSENEQINVTLNSYESSGSSANQLLKSVEMGPKSIELNTITASSVTTSSATWKISTSDNLLLSRRIVLEMPVSYSIGLAGDNIRNYFIAPRADCLNRIITSCQINVNGSSIMSNPSDFCEITQFFSKESQHYRNGGLLSSTPVTPDIVFGHDIANDGTADNFPDTNRRLSTYHLREENFDQSFPSRLAITPFHKVGATGVAGTGAARSGCTFFVRCALKNPILSSVSSEVLANVRDIEITLQFDSARFRDRLFFGTKPRFNTAAAPDLTAALGLVTASIGTVDGTGLLEAPDRSDFKISYYTIAPSNVDMIPETLLVPGEEIYRNSFSLGVKAGDITNVVHPEINLSQIPSMIFISCTPQYSDASKSIFTSDYHAPIRNLNIQVNGRTFTYNLYSPRDFYAQNCKNGYKQPFYSFNAYTTTASGNGTSLELTGSARSGVSRGVGVGGPLCFKLSEDIGGELAVNLTQPCRIQVRYEAFNTSGHTGLDFVSNVHYVLNNTYVLQKGSPVRIINGVSPEEYSRAVGEGFVQTIGMNKDDEQEYLMGGSFSTTFRDVAKGFIKFLNTGNNLLQSAAQIYPDRIPNQLSYEANRANQMAQAVQNSGMLGSGMLGGSRLDMMRANGLLR